MKGLVHIYAGDGKGKTTAALGLGIRAWGRGLKVLIVQFLKGTESGELLALERLTPGFEVLRSDKPIKFICDMNERELDEAGIIQRRLFEEALSKIDGGRIDLLILDELLGVIEDEMLELQRVIDFIKTKPEKMEVVITGVRVPKELAEMADYHSEIRCIRHPMDKGITSREGIEI